MSQDKKSSEGKITSDDNVSNNAHYSESGEITRDDDRDRHDSTEEWNAEHNRTGRNK